MKDKLFFPTNDTPKRPTPRKQSWGGIVQLEDPSGQRLMFAFKGDILYKTLLRHGWKVIAE